MKKKRVMLLGNHAFVIYNFRKELIQQLLKDGYEVYLSMPYDKDKVPMMIKWGCNFIETNVDRRGTNPFRDLKLIKHYLKILKKYKPDVVLTYTIKPNLYGGIACRINKIPYINNITGLGSGFNKKGLLKNLIKLLYTVALKDSSKVFFQNEHDKKVLIDEKIITKNFEVLPGSGVNLKEYLYHEMPSYSVTKFIFVGRIMKDKGIHEFLEAAVKSKSKYGDNIEFNVVGFVEPTEIHLSKKIEDLNSNKVVKYHGYQNDVKHYIQNVHCLIQPSHGGEGLSNVLLEAGAMGRILLASKIPGCQETIEVGKNGYVFDKKNVNSLCESIDKLMNLDIQKLDEMSLYSRYKINKEFDRNIIIERYLKEIQNLTLLNHHERKII
ncbi:glycosyltransferase family 4 protein [Exiguobacterium artemiae]|uniref:glycosyltransferase family 4 protein n=1 Tax=Exiguobacterium artemiae TaxID=340145 RepID=UPI0005527816|nr:glycosyltransferase family 4 protein [Exiguobacterium sibiricum]